MNTVGRQTYARPITYLMSAGPKMSDKVLETWVPEGTRAAIPRTDSTPLLLLQGSRMPQCPYLCCVCVCVCVCARVEYGTPNEGTF